MSLLRLTKAALGVFVEDVFDAVMPVVALIVFVVMTCSILTLVGLSGLWFLKHLFSWAIS